MTIDYYLSKDECEKHKYNRVNTNRRYKHFNQTHFTCGDEEQFEQNRDYSNSKQDNDMFDVLENNIHKRRDVLLWEKIGMVEQIRFYKRFVIYFINSKRNLYSNQR